MRLNKTLAAGAVGALLTVAGFAQAQAPAPVPAPAPAPAASPGAAQVDAKAKAVLGASGAAIKAVKGLTFKVKRELTGNPQLQMGSSGESWFLRNPSTASSSQFYAKGKQTQPLTGEVVTLEGYFNGTIAAWIDEKKKEIVEQEVPAPDVAKRLKTVRDQYFPPVFFENEPFLAEMGAQVIKSEDPIDVAGVKCDVVRLVNPSNQRETRIAIAQSDKLPRRIDQISPGAKGTVQTYSIEITDLKPAEVKPAEFKITVPEGFKVSKIANAAPVPTPPPSPVEPGKSNPPQPAPQQIVKGGLDAGVSAPPWALKRADDSANVTLADQKGKVVVMGFWGPIFADSKNTLTVLEQANSSFKDKGVSIFGVTCRQAPGDAGVNAAKAAFNDAKATFPLLLGGDPVVADYKVRGFPSVAVIGADGKVAAFFEATPSADELKAAVETALKGEAK